MILEIEPFYTFFFHFAWWASIVLLAYFNHLLRRNSLLFDRPREFLWVFCLSVVVWLFFEAYNFRLQNWHYFGVPVEEVLRWPAFILAFGTVLPGIFETEKLLENLGVFEGVPKRRVRVQRALRVRLILLGTLMLISPLISPSIFFPLVWLGFIFLLDPILYTCGEHSRSFLRQMEVGDYSSLARFLTAGLICGALWEFWNFWAGSKWIYAIPYLDYLEVFEMPVLGYLGFPCFALECYLLYQLSVTVRGKLLRSRFLLAVTILLVMCCSVLIIHGIDQLTVVTYKVVLSQ
jgi:hypothetical protein